MFSDPYVHFANWYRQAEKAGLLRKILSVLYPPAVLHQPDAVALATATGDGRPSVRIVLFKGIVDGGLTFYTNYLSRKARELEENPRAALAFYWGYPERQVRVDGSVTRLSAIQSDAYWNSRPRGSQLSAAASHQSEPIESRDQLVKEVRQLSEKYAGQPVPRPVHWGGYLLQPKEFEFWEGKLNRLHDRVRYCLNQEGVWVIDRLSP